MPDSPGTNASLVYMRGGTKHGYRLRVVGISHGMEVIFEESQGRDVRAMYPHRLAPAQFSITVALTANSAQRDRLVRQRDPKAHEVSEYHRFMTWLYTYMRYVLHQDDFAATVSGMPAITVSVPKYRFYREGVPIAGIEFGDHVGSVLWQPTIVFETTKEPDDPKIFVSKFKAGLTAMKQEEQFFYPESKQLVGDESAYTYDNAKVLSNSQIQSSSKGGVAPDTNEAEAAGDN